MTRTIIAAVILILGIAGYYGYRTMQMVPEQAPVNYEAALFTKEYRSEAFNFSFKIPDDFSVTEAQDEAGATIILVESGSHADGVQILITPFDEEIADLNQERIAQDVPDLVITDAQTVEIGVNSKGLAFKSDNEAFDGASREVWFVFRGNLYQISTYDRLDPLLQKMFSTWQFL